MVRASALYIVIVIALVIGIICSSLVVVAYFYREQYQRAFRYDALQNNLNSGINILIASQDNAYAEGKKVSLFGGEADSVDLKTVVWGIYGIGVVRAFIQHDTLSRAFSMAHAIDSAKWAALYLPDEDRPVSVSGKTTLKGNAFLPQSGIREAYVDGKAYQGDKRLVIGKTYSSQRSLPPLNPVRISELEKYFALAASPNSKSLLLDSISHSFLETPKTVPMGKNVVSLTGTRLKGNIILSSDTTVIVGSDAQLDQVLIFAPNIKVEEGFKGNCQLFARDSISVGPDCVFSYPSTLGVLRFKLNAAAMPAAINIGENVSFSGCIFAYDKSAERSKQPSINLGKKVSVSGQIYTTGLLGINDDVVINGSVFTGRFIYRSGFTVFENYVINTTINAEALSPYYLSGDIIPVAARKKKVLQWLE